MMCWRWGWGTDGMERRQRHLGVIWRGGGGGGGMKREIWSNNVDKVSFGARSHTHDPYIKRRAGHLPSGV